MKKTYLAKRNALLSSDSISWGVLALAVVLLFLSLRLLTPNFFWKIVTPVFRTADATAAVSNSFFSSFGNTAALAAQNEKLASEKTALASENATLLKKVGDLSALERKTPSVIAGVVSRPLESPYDTLVLAAGRADGVRLGQEAFGAGGVPIGSVSSVLEDFSRVTLFSAPGARTNGWVGRGNAALTIEGVGGGAMNAIISREAGVAVGDIVFVPGPGMLPVGSVVGIEDNPLSPGVTLRILPAVNLFSTAWVELRATGVTPAAFATSTPL